VFVSPVVVIEGVPTAPALNTTPPVPFVFNLKSISVSSPVAAISGALPVAAFAIVNSFTADAVL
jgi:hypothetical protein